MTKPTPIRWLLVVLIVLAVFSEATAEDWYRWRGPQLNGISVESDWSTKWPEGGPKRLWQKSVGTGFSSVVISEGRLFTLGNDDNVDTVYCLDAESGEEIWHHQYASPLDARDFDGGPTSTPTVDGDVLYTLGRQGDLFCFEAATGKVSWKKNLHEETGAPLPGWGFSGSPLVRGELLLLNVGEAGTAVEKKNGRVVWTSAPEEAGYATPVPFRRGERWLAVIASRKYFIAVDIRTGTEKWRHRWLTRFGCNAADPIVVGNHVFVSSGYNRGSALLEMTDAAPTVAWTQKQFQNQLNSSVLIDGFLYGIDGSTTYGARLKCVEWKTGEVRWTEEGIGSGSLTVANGHLIVLSESGELIVAPASPKSFRPLSRAQVLTGRCWTVPVISNGRIYCRNAAGDLVCLDVRGKQ